MDPLNLCILVGCIVFVLTALFFTVGMVRMRANHEGESETYRAIIRQYRDALQAAGVSVPAPAKEEPEGEGEEEGEEEEGRKEEEGVRTLDERADALGLECSGAVTATTVFELDPAFRPGFNYYKNDLHRLVSCMGCTAEDLHLVYAGESRAFEGCLGCYCFTCGRGVSSNRRLNKIFSVEMRSDLFELFRRWEDPSSATEAPSTDAPTPPNGVPAAERHLRIVKAPDAAPAPGPATETAAPPES